MVEIIPKPTPKLPFKWLNILFYFSLILVLFSIFSFFLIDHFQRKAFQTLEDLESTLAREKTPEEVALEKEIFGYQKKINDFSILLESYQPPLNFFPVLEKNSHPKVQFTDFSLNPKNLQAILSGKTESFQTLDQQLSIFKKENLIKDVNLSKLFIGKEGEVEFTLNLSLSPAIFK